MTGVDPTLEMVAALRLMLDACADLLTVAKDLLERVAETGQFTDAEVRLYRSKLASAEAGSEVLRAFLRQFPQPLAPC